MHNKILKRNDSCFLGDGRKWVCACFGLIGIGLFINHIFTSCWRVSESSRYSVEHDSISMYSVWHDMSRKVIKNGLWFKLIERMLKKRRTKIWHGLYDMNFIHTQHINFMLWNERSMFCLWLHFYVKLCLKIQFWDHYLCIIFSLLIAFDKVETCRVTWETVWSTKIDWIVRHHQIYKRQNNLLLRFESIWIHFVLQEFYSGLTVLMYSIQPKTGSLQSRILEKAWKSANYFSNSKPCKWMGTKD